MNLLQAEFQTLFKGMLSQEKGAELALLDMILQDQSLASATFPILELKQEAHPLFHFSQAACLESVMIVYSLYPKAIFFRTKSGYSPHHFAAGNRNDDVLRFLVLQHPKALSGKPSILQMLSERIDSLDLLKFCISQYPQGLYDFCDADGNTLLHKACQVTSFPYLGPRPAIIEYLVKEYPQAVEIINKEGNLPLHLLLEQSPLLNHNIIHTKSAMLLLKMYPKSRKIPNHAGVLPLDLAVEASGGSFQLILALAQGEAFLPTPSPHVIAAHLIDSCSAPHLIRCKVWDALCPALAMAVSGILNQDIPKYTQLTICLTRIERTGLCLILQALENNTHILQCTLSSNVGFYNQKVGGDAPEHSPISLYCVANGGVLASDYQVSKALQSLFLNNSTLTALDLSDNMLPQDPQFLFPLMQNRSLKWLSLARTNMGPSVLQAIIPVLLHNKTLTDLNLSCPSIPDESVLELLQVLRHTRTLRRVILFAKSEPLVAEAAVTVLRENPHLFHIHFDSEQPSSPTLAPSQGPVPSLSELLDYWSRLNRAGRYYAREFQANKYVFVTKVLVTAHPCLLYGLLRESVSLWSSTLQEEASTCAEQVAANEKMVLMETKSANAWSTLNKKHMDEQKMSVR